MAIGWTLAGAEFVYPIWHPHTAASSSRVISIAGGMGAFLYAGGAVAYIIHQAILVFQMAFALDQKKAKGWTRWFVQLGKLSSFGLGTSVCVFFAGPHFTKDQKGTDALVAASLAGAASVWFVLFLLLACPWRRPQPS